MSTQFLSEQDARQLVRVARDTIETYVRRGETPEFNLAGEPVNRICGTFVSLHKKGALRGCIGFVEGVEPLWQAVRDAAISAATRDPRFPPVHESELPEIDIEISVLTPLEEVTNVEQIEVGTHGLVLRSPGRSGLLLPQVATEYGWTVEEFLDQTCLKAGLSTGAWRDPNITILRFAAQIINE